MNNYRVWIADETEEDGVTIEHLWIDSAVEEYAEHCWDNRDGNEWMTRGADFCAREVGSDVVRKFRVEVEFDPSFGASEVS